MNHKRVARLMRSVGLAGLRLRKKHRTTVADTAARKAPDLISRDFTAEAVNTKYVGDITYLPLENGKFLYLATVRMRQPPLRDRGADLQQNRPEGEPDPRPTL